MKTEAKVLLLVGGAPYHDTREHREILWSMLGAKFDLAMADDPEVLTPENLAGYDVFVNYTSFWVPTEEQCNALVDAVAGGKGIACLHPSSASFYTCPAYLDMIGGYFVYHDPNKLFTVRMSGYTEKDHWFEVQGMAVDVPEHPITQGIDDFQIQDELFVIEGDQTKWHVLARAEGHPVIYTKMWGKGRVCQNALGHDARALNSPSLQTLYIRGIEWAAGLK